MRRPGVWQVKGEEQAFRFFHLVAEWVQAYRDFLAKNKIDRARIAIYADFQNVPPTDKKNYLSRYSLPELTLDGRLTVVDFISSSSGFTGKPSYWPSIMEHELNAAKGLELMYLENFGIDRLSGYGFCRPGQASAVATCLTA